MSYTRDVKLTFRVSELLQWSVWRKKKALSNGLVKKKSFQLLIKKMENDRHLHSKTMMTLKTNISVHLLFGGSEEEIFPTNEQGGYFDELLLPLKLLASTRERILNLTWPWDDQLWLFYSMWITWPLFLNLNAVPVTWTKIKCIIK